MGLVRVLAVAARAAQLGRLDDLARLLDGLQARTALSPPHTTPTAALAFTFTLTFTLEQSAKNLGTGLAGRRKEAQEKGHGFAPNLKAAGFFAIQARERWSLKEDSLYRPGHFWVAQAPDVREVRRITKRETICGQPFHPGDYMIRVGRHFDRVASDPSGLKFEEWQPELVFSADDVGEKLAITASGHVKVGSAARDEIFWGIASFSSHSDHARFASPKRPVPAHERRLAVCLSPHPQS